jgi:hypothetical protein
MHGAPPRIGSPGCHGLQVTPTSPLEPAPVSHAEASASRGDVLAIEVAVAPQVDEPLI